MPFNGLIIGSKKINQMLSNILLTCKTEWIKAKTKRNHPFRYFVLGTVNSKGNPELRTVVLRNFDSTENLFTIFTDSRTKKIIDLTENSSAELLFYDHRKLTQIRVKVNCISIEESEKDFIQQSPNAQKDYTSVSSPGTILKSMDDVMYSEFNYFRKLIFKPYQIEYLRLMRPNHQRAVFNLKNEEWIGNFITP